jgi:small multidrug resistance pump
LYVSLAATAILTADKGVGVRKWALLAGAIVTEVTGILSLRAFQDHPAWLILMIVGYLLSFAFLTLVLRAGMPIGVTYGIWGACGTALTAVLAAIIFGDPFTPPIVVGIVFIVIGVLLVQFGSQRATAARADTLTP